MPFYSAPEVLVLTVTLQPIKLPTPNAKGGQNVSAAAAKEQATWTALNFTFASDNWKWTAGKMPHLFADDLRDWTF